MCYREHVTGSYFLLITVETSMGVRVVVTLSIFSCFVLPGVGYLIHAHIQRFPCKLRIINEEVILEPSNQNQNLKQQI